jgi:hypothetical protein
MNEFDSVEILLAEDSEADAEMTIRALSGKNLANRLMRVKDGAEALDFIFRAARTPSVRPVFPSCCCSTSRCRKSTASRYCAK